MPRQSYFQKIKVLNPEFKKDIKQVILIFFYVSFIYLLRGLFLGHFRYSYLLIALALITLTFVFSKYLKIYVILLFILLYIPNYLYISHFILFDATINSVSLATMFDSNISEAKEFMTYIFNIKFLLLSITIIFVFLLTLINVSRLHIYNRKLYIILLLIFFICSLVISVTGEFLRSSLYTIGKEYFLYQKELSDLRQIKSERKIEKFKNIKSIISELEKSDTPQTYIIVIGESVDRKHLSTYGYYRQTTPLLSGDNSLYVFDNVISPHTHTLPSLKEALTFSCDEIDLSKTKGSIVNYFNDAGFKTFWISNQYFSGPWNDFVSVIAQDSNEYYFINKSVITGDFYKPKHDGELLPIIKKVLEDNLQKKVIFVHLMGSHQKYENRYPKEFDIFHGTSSRSQKVAQYDNSILYTDYVLNQIIVMLKEKPDCSYMLYFADHGEDAYDNEKSSFGHSESIATRHMYEIPFFLWFSDTYKKYRPDIIKKSKKSKHQQYNTQFLIHTIPELSNLDNEDIDRAKGLFANIK